jgi:hypothetical protein
MAEKPKGMCALTRTTGSFVDAHVIPRAFFKAASPDPFKEVSPEGQRPKRIRTGWYDPQILTRAGEDVLAPLDDAAAKAFIQGGFTYSARRMNDDITRLRDGFVANRAYWLENADVRKLRLFTLSLLWRAAVSRIDAFENVTVSSSHLEDLRQRLVAGDPGPHTDYPVYLGVFCSREERSKMAPFRPMGSNFYRFFLDGVLCYVSPVRRIRPSTNLGGFLLGADTERVPLYCFSSLNSAHREYEHALANRVHAAYGNIFSRGIHPPNRPANRRHSQRTKSA